MRVAFGALLYLVGYLFHVAIGLGLLLCLVGFVDLIYFNSVGLLDSLFFAGCDVFSLICGFSCFRFSVSCCEWVLL